ncbi:carbohydrate esterase family 8 protein [Karstenula rhodostoma CBS 690.94]|uniref:pectinesterase n=1 Tax=Karstenula rhodostoma CBS 690.94 TaxID=1392251 RepID=A0A9P4PGT8_9PLEO|nr:carbohydrate esterase family 8 protein [Karstenula rhodostoma CBS 690.94]
MKISTFLIVLASSFGLGSASPLTKRASRTSPPSGCKVVRGSGTQSGEYSTLGAVITALGTTSTASACVFIYGGTYTEQVVIQYKGPLTIYGYTTDTSSYQNNAVTITHKLSSPDAGSLDASATINVKSSSFALYNINVANTYGKGAQAVALVANGSKQGYYGVSFKGYQDTLFAKSGDQYYSNCYMEGAVDYIFGDASAWFGECTIASNGGGSITATSRETSSDPAWYVFDHSTITAAPGANLKGAVYLGRPWRVLSRVMYQNSVLTDVVNAKGWTDMADGATPLYYEYNNSGAGAGTSGRKYLSASGAAVTKAQIWPNSGTVWYDKSY